MWDNGRSKDPGFTLVELLVVMLVLGLLAAVAVPAFTAQRRKAYEATAKSDVKAITKEALAYFVDGAGPLNVTSVGDTWTITSSSGVVATGRLSEHNSVSPQSYVTSDSDYCVAVQSSQAGADFLTADGVGLRPGNC